MSSYKKHEEFLVEFSKLTHFADYVKVEANSEMLNNIVLIATIILNDDMKTEAEKSLQNYIEVFFKNMDGTENMPQSKLEYGLKTDSLEQKISDDEEEDLTSQYSTLSSMLGFQVSLDFFLVNIRHMSCVIDSSFLDIWVWGIIKSLANFEKPNLK